MFIIKWGEGQKFSFSESSFRLKMHQQNKKPIDMIHTRVDAMHIPIYFIHCCLFLIYIFYCVITITCI